MTNAKLNSGFAELDRLIADGVDTRAPLPPSPDRGTERLVGIIRHAELFPASCYEARRARYLVCTGRTEEFEAHLADCYQRGKQTGNIGLEEWAERLLAAARLKGVGQ